LWSPLKDRLGRFKDQPAERFSSSFDSAT
jgi:hypothetical protein